MSTEKKIMDFLSVARPLIESLRKFSESDSARIFLNPRGAEVDDLREKLKQAERRGAEVDELLEKAERKVGSLASQVEELEAQNARQKETILAFGEGSTWPATTARSWKDVRREASAAGLIDEERVAEIREAMRGQFPMASLTADVVVRRGGTVQPGNSGSMRPVPEVLLIRRRAEPFRDAWALPGGFLNASNDESGETFPAAAVRELREETGLLVSTSSLRFEHVRDVPGRDPRGRVVSVVFSVDRLPSTALVAGDDAVEVRWFAVSMLPLMAFDHREIIERVVSYPSSGWF